MTRSFRLMTLGLIAGALCLGQDPRGSFMGAVTDVTGAVVPGASVRFTHGDTQITFTTQSNEQGNYDAPYLRTGGYSVTCTVPGFKTWTRGGLELRIGERVRVDIQLEIGDVAETVEVTAEAPVLEVTTGSIAQIIDTKQLENMPMRSGNVSWLYAMAPGTVLTGLPQDGPWNISQNSAVSVAGSGTSGGIDYNVDGVSNNSYGGQTAFVPPPDMVEEIRLNTTSYDASVGNTMGGQVNISLKSGTNRLRGTLSYAQSTGPMMARNFFTNRFIFDPNTGPITPEKIKANTPLLRWTRYTAVVGGPVYIPKLYDGRNRTFWQFGFQAHERRRPVASLHTVPTAEQAQGNFSSLLAIGPNYQIYDPFTTRPEGANRFRRDPLPNNIIPSSRIDPVARRILGYFPDPNNAGTADFQNNYSRTRQEGQDLYQPIARVDHNFSERHRMFARYTHSDFNGRFDELISGSDIRGRMRQRPHRGVAFDKVWVASPQLVVDVRYGFTWFREFETFRNIGWDLTEFGFSRDLISQMDQRAISFPAITVQGMLPLGNNGGFNQTYYSHNLLATTNWTRGNHSLKFGFDGRLQFDNSVNFGNVAPAMQFQPTFTRGPLDNSPQSPAGVGQGTASLLFGIPTAGGIDVNDSRAEKSPFYGLFVQDDWRATRKLTINLGVRWEYEGPIVERYDRTSRDFDFTTVNPIQSVARAQYALNPIPEIAPEQFRTTGGLTFAGVGVPRQVREPFYQAFMPRIGFAYQPNNRMVLRGGYGIFFGLIGSLFDDVSQPGYNQRTNIIPTNDNGVTYAASIANPFPGGLQRPIGNSQGLETFLGRAPGFFAADGRRPYTQRWSYSMQFEPLTRTVVEVGYIGSRATRLRVNTPMNPIPRELLSTLPVRDNPTINYLTSQVRNPFRGIAGFAGTGLFTNLNVGRQQLLRSLPHFTDLATGLPAGMSWYNAATLRVERRFANGFQAQFNYTWSKTMEAITYLNDVDLAPEYRISDLDRPHRVTFSGIYELPFGRGQRFGSTLPRWLDYAVGGWQANAVFQRQSGPGLNFGNVIYNGTWESLRMPAGQQSIDNWFNTAQFERNAQQQLELNVRSFPTRVAAVRADRIYVWDMSLHKNFQIREGLRVQLRGEAEAATNTPIFNPPNTAPASTVFGQVTQTLGGGQEQRRIFVMLRILF